MLSNVFLSQLVDLLEQLRAIEMLGAAFTFFVGHVDGWAGRERKAPALSLNIDQHKMIWERKEGRKRRRTRGGKA